TPDYFL
nr:Chain C, Serine/threonine-protein phosphatase 2A catalytic subunit alpha isoform [Homo sapiens]4NY3_D Chain D, Serine/threonine-protein phosphatase 2A catalytic subunit alpha isoform [Homo sapiens]